MTCARCNGTGWMGSIDTPENWPCGVCNPHATMEAPRFLDLAALARAVVVTGHTQPCWIDRQKRPAEEDHCTCLVNQAKAALGTTDS